MAYSEQKQWDEHYAGGQGFRQLGDSERVVLGEHVPPSAEDGRAEQLAAAVRSWDLHVRGHGYPQLAVYPVGTDLGELSEGLVLDKRRSRLVFDWEAGKP